jgi:hypothetical protein
VRRAPLLIRQLICVYRFDGGVRGRLGYTAGRLLGDRPCPLCALTGTGMRINPQWSRMVAELAVPVVVTHPDRAAVAVSRAAGHRWPCVLADCRTGPVLLLGPTELVRIDGRVPRFVEELRRAAARAGLSWTLAMHDSSPVRVGRPPAPAA